MNITLVTLSILALTALAYGTMRIFRITLCPICVGVATTWLGMLAAKTLGYAIDPALIALLMGGTAVGIAYRTERYLPVGRSQLLWKTIVVPGGFIAAYSLIQSWYPVFAASSVMLLGSAFIFLRRAPHQNPAEQTERTAELEERMKQCC